ncbi:MAG: zinc-ribbon domain-containing protein [Promethearchaeota archaeon]
MFCPHCGENLLKTNQRFCHNCGTEVLTTSTASNYKTERIQAIPPPKIYYAPVQPRQQLKMGAPGTYSKSCLTFALISITIGILTLIVGYNVIRVYGFPTVRILVGSLIFFLRIGGLVLGVLSKVNSSKAVIFEPYNDVEKAGSIFGILGIIINSIGLFLSLLGPWSIFTFYFW